MAGRPRLEIGTFGNIRTYQTATGFRAMTKFRDFDGITKPVERTGKTSRQAENNLKKAIRDWTGSTGDDVTGETTFSAMAELWFADVQQAVAQGSKSPGTETTYRSILDRHVLPGLGALRLREVTVGRADRFLTSLGNSAGTSSAKTARSVVSGVLGMAARRDAIKRNPVRDTSPISAAPKSVPRALSLQERKEWIAQLEGDDYAVRWELPDLTRFMLATGVRIGEALALYWEDVDLTAGSVAIDWTVVRVKGQGLIRKPTKSSAGERTLPLPSWAIAMLTERLEAAENDDRPVDSPVFPDSLGALRDPSNMLRAFRNSRGDDQFGWVTSHIFRKTAATIMDEAGLSARVVSPHMGHSKTSMTQDVYFARDVIGRETANALEGVFGFQSDE